MVSQGHLVLRSKRAKNGNVHRWVRGHEGELIWPVPTVFESKRIRWFDSLLVRKGAIIFTTYFNAKIALIQFIMEKETKTFIPII